MNAHSQKMNQCKSLINYCKSKKKRNKMPPKFFPFQITNEKFLAYKSRFKHF